MPRPIRARSTMRRPATVLDRKSTRLNSSHTVISYAVFCLKKKKKNHVKSANHNERRNLKQDNTNIEYKFKYEMIGIVVSTVKIKVEYETLSGVVYASVTLM